MAGTESERVLITDSHCHLDEFPDPGQVLAEAAAEGVARVVTMGQEASSMQRALELARQFPGQVLAAVGVHPVNVISLSADELAASVDFLDAHAGQADEIGETGLDYQWAVDEQQQLAQHRMLEHHFELAAQHRLPVNLHSRRCLRQVMDAAIRFHHDTGINAQLHWFTQSAKLVMQTNDAGIYVSVGPSILHDEQAAAVACAIADDLLLLETDAPVPIGGGSGHPVRVREVLAKLAALKSVTQQQLAAQTETNFAHFLGRVGDTRVPGPSD